MDANRFDLLSRTLTSARSRRTTLRILLGSLLGGALLGPEEGAADHGCRHAGAGCTAPGQCCTKRCVTGGVCGCDADNPCPRPKNPCKKAVCNANGRCVTVNRTAGAPCPKDRTVCTKDVCDGQGTCTHPPDASKNGMACESDGNPCTRDVCRDGVCKHSVKADGAYCAYNQVCVQGACTYCLGDACAGHDDCCTNYCFENTCVCWVGNQRPPGGGCTSNAQCCNGKCNTATGTCACDANDISFCFNGDSCCSGKCVAERCRA
jgi:hypothetical protein